MTKLLNINDVMKVFEVKSRQTIYNWVEKGDLPAPQKKWGSPRWDEKDISRALNDQNPDDVSRETPPK